MAIEAVFQEVLKMPADECAELVERLIERGELISPDDVLAQMRQTS